MSTETEINIEDTTMAELEEFAKRHQIKDLRVYLTGIGGGWYYNVKFVTRGAVSGGPFHSMLDAVREMVRVIEAA